MGANNLHIFHLDKNARKCAQHHCDIHVVSKVVEYAQHMSTAHRIVDGYLWRGRDTYGQKVQRYFLDDPTLNRSLYKARHIYHPSALWARSSYENYTWLYDVWVALAEEYTYRFDKIHETYSKLHYHLLVPPEKIKTEGFVQPNPISEYRNNYWENRATAKWTRRSIPDWWVERIDEARNQHVGEGKRSSSNTGGSGDI